MFAKVGCPILGMSLKIGKMTKNGTSFMDVPLPTLKRQLVKWAKVSSQKLSKVALIILYFRTFIISRGVLVHSHST
jgi:hypothetical protein